MEQFFKFSEQAIKQKKRIFLFIQAVIPIIPLVIILPIGDLDLTTKIITLVMAILVSEAALIVPQRIMYAKLRESEARTTVEGIERKSGSFTDKIMYKDINKVLVIENPRDGIVSIEVRSSSTAIMLWGFEKMDLLLNTLETNLSDKSLISRKQNIVNASKLPVILSAMVLGWFVVFLWLKQYGNIADGLFNFVVGLFFFFGKPISKASGTRFRKSEIIGGILLGLFGLFTLLNL